MKVRLFKATIYTKDKRFIDQYIIAHSLFEAWDLLEDNHDQTTFKELTIYEIEQTLAYDRQSTKSNT